MRHKLKTQHKLRRGFTLIETLFGVAIFVIIFGALTLFSVNIWKYNSFISSGLNNVDTGRQFIKRIIPEIRTASSANTGDYPIALATNSAFTFYSDIDDDGLKEKIRYFLSNKVLKRGEVKPTGSPLTYDSTNEKITTVASNVTNTTIFQYYDRDYDGSTSPLSPINIPNIRLVKVTLTLDQDPNTSPTPITFSSQVMIRNLKDNL